MVILVKPNSPMKSISIRLDTTTIDKIEAIASELRTDDSKITSSDVYRKAVEFFLSELYTKRIQIKSGDADE